jgi:dsDNA-specific endonuclease/ATPase MutS2
MNLPYCSDPAIIESLRQFTCELIAAEQRKRYILERDSRLRSEISWIERDLLRLEEKLKRKPSAIREIQQRRYELRRCELELAFLDINTLP